MSVDSRRAVLRTAIWERLEEAHPALVNLCQALIRTPSVNGVRPESAMAAVIADALRERDIALEMPAYAPDRPTVLGEVGVGKTSLFLVGHMDTVPAWNAGLWRYDPFTGAIPTICGFGLQGSNAHAVDEYVEIEGLLQTAKIDGATALDLLLPDPDTMGE